MDYCSRLVLSGTYNTRDLGGIPLPRGVTHWGIFYRSDAPLRLTQEDLSLCRTRNITDIIDLRTPRETTAYPSAFQNHPEFSVHLCPIYGGDQIPEREDDVPKTYLAMAEKHAVMREIFSHLANAKGACLYHCLAGKDRTGVVSALLLLLAGAYDSDILANYSISYSYLLESMREIMKQNSAIPPCAVTARPEYMEKFLQMFREKYKDVEAYLSQIGLDSFTIERLRHKLAP